MTEKICKCGDPKDSHIKNKKLRLTGPCQVCPCSEYQNRGLPNTGSKIILVIGSILAAILLGFMFQMWYDFTPSWYEMVEIELGTLITILNAVFALFIIYFILPWLIMPYFEERRRKAFPVKS